MHGDPLNLGYLLTWITFVATLGAAASFLLWGQGKPGLERPAKILYAIQAAGLLAMGAWLMRLFVTHDFRYAYVANYSARDMDFKYVFSSFWGGQEGTFLMWAIFSTLLAALLLRARSRLVPTALFFAQWAPIFLLFILIVQSPFRTLAAVPLDGAGLNPLLQDPWMTIHPPTLFLGYSSLIVPFALAMATLVHKDVPAWLKIAPPFVLLSIVILGTGFTMGGMWAYKVLGWGGFWGWDPVENASLVPWLFSVALLHGLLVQRATGALGRTTLFLALTAYLFVLYGSFLTRSGVLADFSVHSFVDLGLSGYLLAFMGFFVVTGYGAWVLRSNAFARPEAQLGGASREFALWLGMLVFCLMAILTMAGTSAPLLSRMFGPPGNVATEYYARVNGPLGLLVCLLVAMGPLARWRQESSRGLFRAARPSLLAALLALTAAAVAGVRSPMTLLLVFGAVFAFTSNVQIVVKASRRGLSYAAGYVSHLGFAIMLLGVLTYSTFGRDRQVALPRGQTVEALGLQLRYDGVRKQKDGKDQHAIAVVGEGRRYEARPVLYFSEFNQSVMRNPHVERFWNHDVYIAPIELKTADDALPSVTLAKGQAGEAGGVALAFRDFEREGQMGDPKGFTIRAVVAVGPGPDAPLVRPAVAVSPYGLAREPVDLPGGGTITLANVDPNTGTAQLAVRAPGAPAPADVLAVEVSTKPFIGLVWIGMATLLFGAGLGIRRRLAQKRREEAAAPATPVRVAAAP
ncbi:MAG: cytochrome c biogenesis protein CcsA [Candidatus Eisenbacteria bacterium]